MPANKEKLEFTEFSKDNPKNRTLLKVILIFSIFRVANLFGQEVLRAAGTGFAGYQPVLQRKFDALEAESSLGMRIFTIFSITHAIHCRFNCFYWPHYPKKEEENCLQRCTFVFLFWPFIYCFQGCAGFFYGFSHMGGVPESIRPR